VGCAPIGFSFGDGIAQYQTTLPHTHQHNTLVEMQRMMIVSTLPAADMRSQAYGGRGEYAACATTASMAAAAAMSATACCTAAQDPT
jgi:hypothetical protein